MFFIPSPLPLSLTLPSPHPSRAVAMPSFFALNDNVAEFKVHLGAYDTFDLSA